MRNFWNKIKALFQKSEVEKTSLQKTARIAIIFAAVAIVGLIIFFAAVYPLLQADEEYVPELFEGEVYKGGSLYMLRTYEREEIASIRIKNANEDYTLIPYTLEDGSVDFLIEGQESIRLSSDQVAYYLSMVRNLLTYSVAGEFRVNEQATKADLASYGLDEASDPAFFEVELYEGGSFRVYVGNSLVTSNCYYAILEGRKNTVDGVDYDIVYALSASMKETILANSAALLSTELTTYDTNIYQATVFSIEKWKGEERDPVVIVGLAEDTGIAAASALYELVYPSAYIINEDAYSEIVLTNLAYVTATEILAYGEKIYTPEVYEQYGLDLDPERIGDGTDKNYAVVYYSTTPMDDENFEQSVVMLYFSEKQTALDGSTFYYVYSPERHVIGTLPADTYKFVEWGISEYTNPYLYFEYFTSCEWFEIVSERENLDYHFEALGKERTRKVTVTTTAGDIVYYVTESGDLVPMKFEAIFGRTEDGNQGFLGDYERFRTLYYVLITRELALYAEIDEEMTSAADTPYATIRVQTEPKDHPISYYLYENGVRGTLVRDQGGNILCHKVVVPTTLSDGTVKDITYDKAYYDEDSGRFFLKIEDSNDGNIKPAGVADAGDGTVKITSFLPMTAYGEYNETVYSYEIYDLYDTYTDYDGNSVSQLNSTYKYVIPSTTTNTYRLTSGGEKELIESTTERAEVGVYIRTAMIDKLFSDTHKFINGDTIDTMGAG